MVLTGLAVACSLVLPAPAALGQVPPAPSSGGQATSAASWPTLRPQGGRWKTDGTRTVHDYYRTTPLQGGKQDRAAGSTRWYAIKVWQELLTEHGYPAEGTGVYDRTTEGAVRAFQQDYDATVPAAYRLGVDGRIGYPTARALLAPTIHRAAERYGVPAEILCGHLGAESTLDARAVGPEGSDYGLAQLSSRYHQRTYTLAQAFDEDVAVPYMARRDRAARKRYGSYTIGVVAYWSPAAANRWKRTGKPSAEAKAYSRRVKKGCAGYEFRDR